MLLFTDSMYPYPADCSSKGRNKPYLIKIHVSHTDVRMEHGAKVLLQSVFARKDKQLRIETQADYERAAQCITFSDHDPTSSGFISDPNKNSAENEVFKTTCMCHTVLQCLANTFSVSAFVVRNSAD